MFSLRRNAPTSPCTPRLVWLACTFIVTALIGGGCSRQTSDSNEDWTLDSGDVVRAETLAGGVDATYAAHFEDGQLQRITEARKTSGISGDGDYEFKGARLVRYRGASLTGGGNLDLRFDMQGALIQSDAATNDEVAAIVNRASLLRSLALARRATLSHGG